MAWTVRYRFITSKPLTSDAPELPLEIGGRKATISSDGGVPLRTSNWMTLYIHDFADEESAREFGRSIALAVHLTGVRQGVEGLSR